MSKVLILAGDFSETLEVFYPYERLREEGYEVVGEASDGQGAVDLTSELKPDLVIMDIKMPVRDGIDAATEIAANRAGSSCRRVGGAGQGPEAGDDALSGGDDRDDRALGHEVDERLVERLALMLGVVGGEFLGGGGALGEGDDVVALRLERRRQRR